MDQVTQQNAAMVEQSTAASHSLAQETEQLFGLIGQFRIGPSKQIETARHEPPNFAPRIVGKRVRVGLVKSVANGGVISEKSARADLAL
jgi:methyl-accepting chemotaxis protein